MPLTDREKYDLPSTPRAEYLAIAPDLQLVRDLLGGTRAMHRRYSIYISKFESEPAPRHKIRATVATVYGALARALSASVGMLFAKPPAKEQADSTKEAPKKWPAPILRHYENLDGKGTGGDVLLKRRSRDSIADGFAAILIDHPPAPPGVVVTEENEDELNLRPIWVSYTRADVLSWITATVNNVETLVQVVLREGSSTRVGRYGVEPRVRYRVCRLNMMRDPAGPETAEPQLVAWWEVVEEQKDDSGNVTAKRVDGPGIFRDRAGDPFDEIPLAVPYSGPTDAPLTADIPLLDLAWANLEYWQIATERRWYNRLSAYPQPVVEGELVSDSPSSDGGQVIKPSLKLGPTTLVNVKAGSKFSYAEVSGKSAETLEKELLQKKDEMAELGASFLSKKTRGVETAEAKRIDAAAENSTLSTAGQGLEDGFNEALRLHARYLGIPAERAPTVKINRDFEGILMDAPVMQAYVQLVNAGYPKRLVLEALQVGGRIADDADLDKLEQEWEAGLQAERDQAAMEREQLQQQNGTPKPRTRRIDIERDSDKRPVALVATEG